MRGKARNVVSQC